MEMTYRRIFVCKSENAYEWGKDTSSCFQFLRDDDLFLIYQISVGKVSLENRRYIDKLGKKAIVTDTSMMSESDRCKVVVEDLLSKESYDAFVIFLSDDSAYRYAITQSLPFDNIREFKNIKQAIAGYSAYERKKERRKNNYKQHQTYNDDVKAKPFKENRSERTVNKEQNKKNHNKDYQDDKFLLDKKNDSSNIDNEKSNNKSKNQNNIKESHKHDNSKHNTEKKEQSNADKNIDIVSTDDSDALGAVLGAFATTDESVSKKNSENGNISKPSNNNGSQNNLNSTLNTRNNTPNNVSNNSSPTYSNSNNKPNNPQQKQNNGQAKDSSQNNTLEKEQTIEEIEKEIFTGEMKSDDVVREYSELDDSKAKTAELTFKRLVKGIKKYLDKDVAENAKQEEFFSFVMTIIKSYDFNDFIESWQTINAFPIDLKENEYFYLKDEATYYGDMCQMFYGRDKW